LTFRFRQFLLATAMPKLCIRSDCCQGTSTPYIDIPSVDRNSVNMTASKVGKRCALRLIRFLVQLAGLRIWHPRFFSRRTNEPVSRNETAEIDRLPVHLQQR
jgi:hypothetical protein